MKRMLIPCAAGLLLLLSVIFAFADAARPKPSPAAEKFVLHTNLTIVPDIYAYEATLRISESDLQSLLKAASAPHEQSIIERVVHSPTRTLLAGVFMFLSVSFAGVWLARSGQRRSHKAIAVLVLCAVVIGAATIITRANAGPPASSSWYALPQALNDRKATSGRMTISIVPEGQGVQLIVPVGKNRKP